MQSHKKKSRKIQEGTKRATINFGFDGKITYVKNTNKVLGFSRQELLGKKFPSFLVSPYDSLFQPSLVCKFLENEAQVAEEQPINYSFTNDSQLSLQCNNQHLPLNMVSETDLRYRQMQIPFNGSDVLDDLLPSNLQNLHYLRPSAQIPTDSNKRKRNPADDETLAQPILKRAIIECVGKKGEHIPLHASMLQTTKGGASRELEFSCSLQKLENETLVTVKDNGIIIYCDEKFPAIFDLECNKTVGSNICNFIPTYNRHALQIQIQKTSQFKTNFLGCTFNRQRIFLRVEGVQTNAREFTLWSLKISKVDLLMDALLGLNESGTILSSSGFCELLLGYQSSQLSGKCVDDFVQTAPSSGPVVEHASPELVSGSQVLNLAGSSTDAAKCTDKSFALTDYASSCSDSGGLDKRMPQGSGPSSPKISIDPLSLLNLNSDLYFLLPDGWWVPISTRLIPVTENSSDTTYYLQITRTSMEEFWEHPSEAIGNYYFVSQLGKGSSSNVWLGMRKTDFKLYAVKTLKPPKDNSNHVHDEATILKSLQHPHIVQFVEVMQVNDAAHIVMEHIDGVDLMTLVNQSNGLPESLARAIFMQVLSALRYCHFEAKIVHRDLKPQNVIVDKLGRVKLIDFGYAHKIEDGPTMRCMCGTPAYAPPGLLTGKCFFGPEMDLWSLGILLYMMVTAKLPFHDVEQVLQGTYEEPPVTSDCLDLIHILLERDDMIRLASYERVIEHPWISRSQSRDT